jgi:hypothetical protein
VALLAPAKVVAERLPGRERISPGEDCLVQMRRVFFLNFAVQPFTAKHICNPREE